MYPLVFSLERPNGSEDVHLPIFNIRLPQSLTEAGLLQLAGTELVDITGLYSFQSGCFLSI